MHADTVRLAFRLSLEGDGTSGRMGVKSIAVTLNARKLYTRTGGRWGVGAVHRMLTRTTYIGRHEFNKRGKTKALKPIDRREERSERRRAVATELAKRAAW